MKSKKMNDDCCKQVHPKRAKSECGEMKDKDKKYIINATANTNITIINNILNPQRRNFIVDNTNDLTIKKSNLKNSKSASQSRACAFIFLRISSK